MLLTAKYFRPCEKGAVSGKSALRVHPQFSFLICVLFVFPIILGIKPRTSGILGKPLTSELHRRFQRWTLVGLTTGGPLGHHPCLPTLSLCDPPASPLLTKSQNVHAYIQ